jgi:N-acetylmuramic acid 6-phosphate etherase
MGKQSNLRNTEQLHKKAAGLDALNSQEVLGILLDAQIDAIQSVRPAIPSIDQAAKITAQTIGNGGLLVYAAAGSSGLMALADGLELPGTFGVSKHAIRIFLAGGKASLSNLEQGSEDDFASAVKDASELSSQDCVIALSASGSTPYPLGVVKVAKQKGASVIGISNTPDSELLYQADIAIYLPTPAEVIAGSTRLGAGSAQKVTLNMISTLMGIHLGHVYDGYMVNLHADNAKLIERAARMIAAIGNCSTEQAARHLKESDGSVKLAILVALGASSPTTAKQILNDAGQNLRRAISELKPSKSSK